VSRCTPLLCVFVLALSAGCGSTPNQPTSHPFTVEGVDSARTIMGDSRVLSYQVWASVVAVAPVSGTVDLSITLSGGGAPPMTHREPSTVSIPAGQRHQFYVVLADPAPATAAHSSVQVTVTLGDGAGQRVQASGSAAVRNITAPELTASAERTTLAAGETTRIHWRASGATSVNITPRIVGAILPAEGAIEITPCPGTTIFDVWTQNLSGEARVRIPVTVDPPPMTPWFCGVWSGQSSETWTDANGTPGSWSGGVTLSLFQSGGQIVGYLERSLQSNGLLVRPLDGRVGSANGSIAATIPAQPPGFPTESGPRFACPIELAARLSTDGATLVGTFRAQCRPEGGPEVTLSGQFDARKLDPPYPRRWP
jgi:hypothetical protein